MDQAIDFKRSIQQAKKVAEGGDLSRAIALADAVLAKYPYEQDGWMLRSALFHLSKNYEQALDDVKRAIKMNPFDSFLHYTHGWMVYELTRYDEAANYFSKAIDLYGVHRNDGYSEGLHFMRAEAFLKLGDREAALTDLSLVSDRFQSWSISQRSKQDLVDECK